MQCRQDSPEIFSPETGERKTGGGDIATTGLVVATLFIGACLAGLLVRFLLFGM